MNEDRIKELFSSEEYVKGLFELGNYEKASEKLAEDGVEVSADELRKVLELAKKRADGELSDEELENVAGGSVFLAVLGAIVGGVYLGAVVTLSVRTC